MDLNQVFAVLQQADQQAQKTNPYGGFESISDQLGGVITKAAGSGNYGFGEILGASLLDGLMGGVAQHYGNEYRADQNKMAMDSLANIWKGGDAAKPDGMNSNVWASISGPGQLFKAQRDIENQQLGLKADLELRNDVKKAMITEAVKNPYSPFSQKILQGLGISADAPAQPAPEAAPMVSGPGMSPGSGNFAADPLDLSKFANAATAGNMIADNVAAAASKPKTMQDYLMQAQGNQAAAEAAYKRDLEAPDRSFKDVGDLRNEFQKKPEVVSFIQSDIGIKSLRNAIKDPSATSDLELVRGAIQAIEPGMAVREGEAQAVQQSGSIPDQWKGALNKALNGESGLPDDVRKGILRIAERRYTEYATKFNDSKSFYEGLAQKRGLDPSAITYMPMAQVDKAPTDTGTQNQGAPQAQNPGQTGAPPPARPGFKMQMNRTTGEFREVPLFYRGAATPVSGGR